MNLLVSLVCALQHSTCVRLSQGKSYKRKTKTKKKKMPIVGEGPGETPSGWRWISYLINSFLTDVKQLAKTVPKPLTVWITTKLGKF